MRFNRRLDGLERYLENTQIVPNARTDLPPLIIALATRLGVRSDHPTQTICLSQAGTMWFKPGGLPQAFTAWQKIGTSVSGFVWRADIGPFGSTKVVDSFIAGRGCLEARIFGTLRVARIEGTAAINEGEELCYLAELPLHPDAILFDHSLEWSAVGAATINFAKGQGASRAKISFQLDDAGLISAMRTESRSFDASGKRFPWHGRFWAYQERSGRLIPIHADVARVIDGEDFIYWRGKTTEWVPCGTPVVRA